MSDKYAIADNTPRTVVGEPAHRIYVKFLGMTTRRLAAICESRKSNTDDEVFELTERLNAAGYDWRFDDAGNVEMLVRDVEEARENRK